MISRVFSPEIETREQGTFRYLILYRKSVEGGGGQEPVLITGISPRAPRAPFTYVSHPLLSSSISRAHPLSFLSYLSLSFSPLSKHTHTHTQIYARTHPHVVLSRTSERRQVGVFPRDTTLSLCRRRFSGRNWNAGINVSQLEIQHVAKITDEECHGAFRATARRPNERELRCV